MDIADARASPLIVALAAALPHGVCLPAVHERELTVPLAGFLLSLINCLACVGASSLGQHFQN